MADPLVPPLVACEAGTRHRLWLKYADGVYGHVDLGDLLRLGAFSLLRDPDRFAEVHVRDGAVTWAAGVRLDSAILYYELIAQGARRPVCKEARKAQAAHVARYGCAWNDVAFVDFMCRVLAKKGRYRRRGVKRG